MSALGKLEALLPPVEPPKPPAAAVRSSGPLPALPRHLERMLAEPTGPDRSGQTHALVAAALEWGFDDGQVHSLLGSHGPTVEKYGNRLEREVDRELTKLRADHQHPGQPCDRAGCPNRPRWMTGEQNNEVVTTTTPTPPALEWQSSRLVGGGSFVLDVPTEIPALWGSGDQVLWSRGEALMIVGPPGVGKSTLAQQVVLARLGLGSDVLNQPVVPTSSRVLYLACDRPPQIARSLRRMVGEQHRDLLDERLVVWKGPPPADFAKQPGLLLAMAQERGCDTVVVDSLKDVAIGLSEDPVGAAYNNARQNALAAGVEVMELHHQTKRGGGGVGKPNTLADVYGSAWITAGAGSVVLLWGQAGDPVVQLSHLKQPAETIGPLDLLHDHHAGRTRIKDDTDPLLLLRATPDGVNAAAYARLLYVPDSSRQPTTNEVEKARRKLDGLVRRGLAVKSEPLFGGAAGTSPTTYLAVG